MPDKKGRVGKYVIWYNSRNKQFLEVMAKSIGKLTPKQKKELHLHKMQHYNKHYQIIYENNDLSLLGMPKKGEKARIIYLTRSWG